MKNPFLSRPACALVLAGWLLAAPSDLFADGPRELGTRLDRSPLPRADLPVENDQLSLTLDKAITLALQRNLSLVIERFRRERSILGIDRATGQYDINLTSTNGFRTDSTPTGEDAPIVDNETWFFNHQLTKLTAFGGNAQVDFNNSRFETSDLRFQLNSSNPRWIIDLDFSFTQPLLRGFGRTVTEREILVAKNNSSISRETFQAQVEQVVRQVSDTYWQLVEAREQLKVAQESLDLAKELHEMNRIQVEVGTLAPLEMVQSEAGVAAREEDIIRLGANVEDAADNLRRYLNVDAGELWEVDLVPSTDPEVAHDAIDVGEAVRAALRLRPDVRSKILEIENLSLDAKVADNEVKPRVDAFATWGVNAIRGRTAELEVPGDPTSVVFTTRDYADAFDQLARAEFSGWRLGVQVGYTLRNRTAKAASAIADLAVEQGKMELQDLEQQVLTEVRQAVRGVETAAKQIESARVSSKLARKNLEAERKRYENGLSTSFQVLEIQEDLSQALSREVSAVIGYRSALVAYQQATGQLLESSDIVLVDESSAAGE